MLFSLNSERTFNNINKNTPEDVGPGHYDIIPVMGNKKKMKAPFGTRGERSIFPKPMESPSPGEYEPKPLNSGLAITSVFMSESNRKTFSSNSNPDPTKYSHLDGWCESPLQNIPKKQYKAMPTTKTFTGYVGQSDVTCYTMNEKGEWVPSKKKKKTTEDIGPGSYFKQNQSQGTAIPISIGRGVNRNIFKMNESFPGPGSYTPQTNSNKIPIKISSVQRNSLSSQKNGDGTNFLDLKEWVEPEYEGTSIFKSRDIRKTFKDPEPTPAPTAYYRPPRQHISSGNGFGVKAERTSYSALNSNPGPGSYEPKVKWINKDKTVSFRKLVGRSISSNSASNNSNDVPGPGKYDTKDPWLKSNMPPSSVFESKVNRGEEKVNDTPGAGAYNPRIIDKDHAVPTLIHESRFSDQSSWVDKNQIENPAPDYYQSINLKPGKGKTISSTSRDKPDRDQFPGPGAYNVLHASLKSKCYNAKAPKDNDD